MVDNTAKVGGCISGGFGILAQAAKLPTTVLTTGAGASIGSFREAKTGGHNKHFGALEEASNGPCQAELSRPWEDEHSAAGKEGARGGEQSPQRDRLSEGSSSGRRVYVVEASSRDSSDTHEQEEYEIQAEDRKRVEESDKSAMSRS